MHHAYATYLLNTVFSGMIEALVRGQAHLSTAKEILTYFKKDGTLKDCLKWPSSGIIIV
jgi:hypothetical protein